ncbi:fungal-specific transcription factor domain-containing protein [Mycena rosella]|uniref:Fungal-specific transcription factor domain-containing protein n=1 Tax=Mycena rosella TaxID=1033263 RepID=A0AAD7GRB5_MYCRO|nr:fungal-specific transcription factor domain-containing protein [Mycena rosella]
MAVSNETQMASYSFQLLSDQEVIDMKRSRGIMACAECQRRKLKCNKQFPCTSCVRRGRADICPTGDLGPIGRGKRVMRTDSMELSTTIQNMGDRIRQLETVLEESDSTHPLLREDLLAIKRSSELPRSSVDPTPAQLVDTFGALAVSTSGTPRYYGPTAGPAALLSTRGSAGGDRAEFASPFAEVIESFPFEIGYSSSWDTVLALDILLGHLPDELRAWALYDVYVQEASWYGTPILADELRELVTDVYDPNRSLTTLSAHALALLFVVFALAALADLSCPPYSAEADTYFDLARTALALQPVFGSRDLHTIQALVLTALYQSTGGPRYNGESSWGMHSLGLSLCNSLRLHRESAHEGLDNKTAQRRRAMFWEIYSLETYLALSFARPLSIPPAEVTCGFPADTEQTIDTEGRTVPGFLHIRWQFTKDVTAAMAQAYTSATPPTYEEVLELDQRLRQFIEGAPFAHYDGPTFLAYLRAHLIPRFCGDMMLYMHRSSFVQALKDAPHNPLASPYAASFLAAYRGASRIIKADLRSFALYPEHFHRWWPIWKSLVNAAFIVGSIVVKCPNSEIVPMAFVELLSAVQIIEQGAAHSFLAAGSLPVLHRLRNKAAAVYSATRPDAKAPLPPPAGAYVDETDLAMLSGAHPLLAGPTQPVCAPTPAVAMPSLIPGLMPPPPESELQIPDDLYTNFDFEALMDTAAPSPPGDSLEAYLAAQMCAIPTAYHAAVPPQANWAAFVSSLH